MASTCPADKKGVDAIIGVITGTVTLRVEGRAGRGERAPSGLRGQKASLGTDRVETRETVKAE